MNIAVEYNGCCRRLHSCDVPGAFAEGAAEQPLALDMRAETARFGACFPWLTVPSVQVCAVVERAENPALQLQMAGGVLLKTDTHRTPEELVQMCRLLRESAALFEQCYRSFPDAAYDYMEGEEHPPWKPACGDEAMHRYVRQLDRTLKIWQTETCGGDWLMRLNAVLDALQKRPEFMENRLFQTAEGPCCAGYWLRCRIEECHLAGRQLYELGAAAFGRFVVKNTFHFSL